MQASWRRRGRHTIRHHQARWIIIWFWNKRNDSENSLPTVSVSNDRCLYDLLRTFSKIKSHLAIFKTQQRWLCQSWIPFDDRFHYFMWLFSTQSLESVSSHALMWTWRGCALLCHRVLEARTNCGTDVRKPQKSGLPQSLELVLFHAKQNCMFFVKLYSQSLFCFLNNVSEIRAVCRLYREYWYGLQTWVCLFLRVRRRNQKDGHFHRPFRLYVQIRRNDSWMTENPLESVAHRGCISRVRLWWRTGKRCPTT